ncbi:MAG: hypothetical protein ACP5N3_06105 [Candidatus Nanoarchaeia archaeon]
MELSKEEFEALWRVEHSWEDNPDSASDDTNESIKKFQNIFLKLEDAQLLDVHIIANKIHDATVTEKGLEVLRDPNYKEWAHELMEKNQ